MQALHRLPTYQNYQLFSQKAICFFDYRSLDRAQYAMITFQVSLQHGVHAWAGSRTESYCFPQGYDKAML